MSSGTAIVDRDTNIRGVWLADPATGAAAPSGTPSAPMSVAPAASGTATKTSPAGSASPVTLLAANTGRLPGSTIANDSSAILYILLGAGTVSSTNFTVAIDAKSTVPGVYFMPDGFTGVVTGVWASATGNARVTELSA